MVLFYVYQVRETIMVDNASNGKKPLVFCFPSMGNSGNCVLPWNTRDEFVSGF